MGSLSTLITDAFTIYSEAYIKIGEIGVEVVDLEGSPRQPRKINQLIEVTNLYCVISPSITLNNDGDEIIGVDGDVDTINNLLLKLKRAAGLYKLPAFPTPLTSFNFDFITGGINVGPGQLGDFITNDGTDWVILNMGAPGTVPVATVNGVQWQSVVGNGIPSGGTTNQYLRKASNTSYDVVWDTLTVSKITDITASAAELNILDGVVGVSTAKINFLANVDSDIQDQINNKISSGLSQGAFYVGNASDLADEQLPTGDVTFSELGVFAITAGAIINADIAVAAAIGRSKLASGNTYRLVINNATGVMDEASALTASRVLVSDANGIPTTVNVSTSTILFMDATSSVQTQLNNRLTVSLTSPAQGAMLYYNGTNWINFAVGTNGQLLSSNGTIPVWVTDPPTGLPAGGTAGQFLIKDSITDYDASWHTFVMANVSDVSTTSAELNLLSGLTVDSSFINYLSGADSNIQNQIDDKLNRTLNQNHLFVGNSSNIAIQFATGTNGYVLTSVSGVPTWQPASAGSPPGSDTQVIFNDGGSFGADAGITYNKTANTLAVLLRPAAGTTAANTAPIKLTSGTAMTTPEDGALEYHTSHLYFTIGSTRYQLDQQGGVLSGLTTNRIPYATSATTLGDDAQLTWSSTTNSLNIDAIRIHSAGNDNCFMGTTAGNFTVTGTGRNVGIGTIALSQLTSGSNNTAVGHNSSDSITTGATNTALGAFTLAAATAADSNTAIGYSALGITTGNNNIALGYFAGQALTSGSRNIIIGNDIDAQSATGNDQLTIQNIIFGVGNSAVDTSISTGSIGIGEPAPTRKLEVAGSVAIKAGTSSGQIATVGGTIETNTTTTGNVGAGEDTIFTYTIPPNTLGATNDSIHGQIIGTLAANTNGKRLRLKLGATTLLDENLGFGGPSAGEFWVYFTIVRTGATSAKCFVELHTTTTGNDQFANYVVSTEDLTTGLALAFTAEATSDNDVVGEIFKVRWAPSE